MIKKEDMQNILVRLSNRHKWFYSEANFRQELSICIRDYYNENRIECEVIQEYSFPASPYESLDILVKFPDKEYTAIELKYKKEDCGIKDGDGEYYILKEQSAINISLYLFWKDVYRLEHFSLCNKNIVNGYAIFLTNDAAYNITAPRDNQYEKFQLVDGRIISSEETLWWTRRNKVFPQYEKPFHLYGEYEVKWNNFDIESMECYSTLDKGKKEIRNLNKTLKGNRFDMVFLEVDCKEIRKKLFWANCNLFTSCFIRIAAEATYTPSIIKKANKKRVTVYDYVKSLFSKAAELNNGNDDYKLLKNDDELRKDVNTECTRLEREYYSKDEVFLSFIKKGCSE